MKKLWILSLAVLSLGTKAQTPALNVINVTGSNSITCLISSINMVATVSNYTQVLNVQWQGSGAPVTGTAITITSAGQYTVTASNNAVTLTQTFTIGQNTMSPVSLIAPTFQNVTCLSGIQTVTAAGTPTINMMHNFYSPSVNAPVSVQSFSAMYSPGGPGTYTYCLVDNTNGCSTCKTFTVASSDNFPILTASTSANFNLGCGSQSTKTVQVLGDTSPIPNGSISYTLLPPGFSGSYNLGGAINYSYTTPGTYTAVVRDNSNNCQTKASFSILQATPPTFTYSPASHTLSCSSSTATLYAFTTMPGTNFIWTYVANNATLNSISNTHTVSATNNSLNISAGAYTLTAANAVSTCSIAVVIPVYQNLFAPVVTISPATTSLSCNTASITLTNNSTTGIPPTSGFATNQAITSGLWAGPTPQLPANSATYAAATPGTYTLYTVDPNNGCAGAGTTVIADNRVYPVLTSTTVIVCLPQVPLLSAGVTGNAAANTYTWTAPDNTVIQGANSATITPGQGYGDYKVVAQNILSGCSSTATITADNCNGLPGVAATISLAIYPNPGNGLFTIKAGNVSTTTSLDVYNITGALIRKQTITSGESAIDLRNEPNGIYFISVSDAGKAVRTLKVVKQ